VEKGWEAGLHDLIGLPSPGEMTQEFWALWPGQSGEEVLDKSIEC